MSNPPFDLEEHLVLEVLAGSHAYGTATEDSDEDYRGVILCPEEYYTGLKRFDQFAPKPESYKDVCYYDIKKFLTLAMKGNPSVLEIFFQPRKKTIEPYAHSLLSFQDMVLSKRLVKHHIGMAQAHMARIDQNSRHCGEKGKACIEKYGYNTKDAAHVLRVLSQGYDLLMDGKIEFPSPIAADLIDIRNGKWDVERVRTQADILIERLREAEEKTDLPDHPDENLVSENCMHLIHGWTHAQRSKKVTFEFAERFPR